MFLKRGSRKFSGPRGARPLFSKFFGGAEAVPSRMPGPFSTAALAGEMPWPDENHR